MVFDVGYTLLDETRRWEEWAEWIEVKPEELWASLRGGIVEGVHHVEALRRLAPHFDLRTAQAERARSGRRDEFLQDDLYADVSPCVARLKAAGIKVGAAGNMREDTEHLLAASGLGFDVLGSSERWQVQKPNSMFFRRMIEAMQLPASQLAYVGDRLDNDVAPAAAAGMMAIFLRRGPWAEVLGAGPGRRPADAEISSLSELPPLLAQEGRSEESRTPPNSSKNVSPASR